ncbi:hypothetical protein QTP70_033268, partial [Hemibagrus guttatus]
MQAQEEGSALFLRCLLSPLRLLSAAVWHLIQQEAVTHYGMLEEFVSLITDTLPELLSYRQKTQLTIGLRAKLVLELCGMESPADPDTVQASLQRIETLVALHKELEAGDTHVEESGANFVALVKILMKDPAERIIFFKDVYPLQYGVKFSTALQKMMWLFLSRLESALPQPTLEEAAHILSTAPTVMEECIQSLSQPQQMRNILKYQKEFNAEIKEPTQLWSTSPDDCILSCLSSPQLVQILLREQTPLDTQSESGLDYIPSYCQEVQVESVVITQYIQNELETNISEENDDSIQYDAQESKECDPADTKNSTEVVYEEVESVDTVNTLDERSEKEDPVQVSVVDMEAADAVEESLTPREEKGTVKNQKEATESVRLYKIKQPFVKLYRLDLSATQLSKTFNLGPRKRGCGRPKKDPQNKTSCRKKQEDVMVPCASINKLIGLKNGISSIVPKLKKKYTVVKGASGEYACSLCSFQDGEEIQLHHHLIVHHPEEYKQLCVAKEEKEPQDVVNSPVSKRKGEVTEDGSEDIKVNDSETTFQDLHNSDKSNASLQESVCMDEQEQQGNAAQSMSNSFLTCSQLLEIQKHMHVHWGEDPLQCSQCGKYCLSQSELARHTLAHEKESKHPCTLCSETLERLESLREHYLNVHDIKGPYQCSKCDKTHTDLKALVKHMKTHSEERPYQCSYCSKSFKQRSALTVHAKIHTGDKPFLCEECGKRFSSNISLQRHSVSHKSERPYTCSQCKNHFKTRYALQSHLLKHTTGASIPCEFCGKMFFRASALHRHRRTHTGERPYSCPKCAKTFLTKGE